jgi:hypothetical protein
MESDITQLGIKIITEKNYILVKPPEGVDYWQIFITIGKLFSMPEFQENNDLWVFREGQFNITYSDLFKIKDFVQKNCPKDVQAKKTAIVIETGMQSALAKIYKNIGKTLPQKFRVFNDFHCAEKWITEVHQ